MSELPPQDDTGMVDETVVLDPFKQFVAFILFDMVTLGVFPLNIVYDVYLSLHFI